MNSTISNKVYLTQHWNTPPSKHVSNQMLQKKFMVSGFKDPECNGLYKLKTDWNTMPNGIIYQNQYEHMLKFDPTAKFGGWFLCHYMNIGDGRYDNKIVPNSGWSPGQGDDESPPVIDINITITEV